MRGEVRRSLVHHIYACWTHKANAGLFADTDKELDFQPKNFVNHIRTHNQKLQQKQAELQEEGDAVGDLWQKHQMDSSSPRKRHVNFTNLHPFVPEGESSQRHQDNIKGCEALIWSMVPNIKGYEHSPLEVVKAVKFSTCIAELQKKQNQDIESLQMGALRTKSTSRSCRTSMLTSRASDFTKITTIVRSSATFFTSTSEWRCLIHSC